MKSGGSHEAIHNSEKLYLGDGQEKTHKKTSIFFFTSDSMTLNQPLQQFRDAISSVKPSYVGERS